MYKPCSITVAIVLIILFLSFETVLAQRKTDTWPKKVLITNDDGIQDTKIIELARAFSKVADTYVVAPLENRSGSSHYVSVFTKYTLKVEEHQLGEGIHAYGVDGYPADCVLLSLGGFMRDAPPDLVISGINDGPNLAFDWMFSGTIGAAEVAAFFGVPALAISGWKEDIPGSLKAITQWVVRLSQSEVVRQLKSRQYLTVSIPQIDPKEIKGIRVSDRADILPDIRFNKSQEDTVLSWMGLWQLQRPKPINAPLTENDAFFYKSGFIVVVPMIADQTDHSLLSHLKDNLMKIPKWSVDERAH